MNGAFTLAGALVLLVGAGRLSPWLGLPPRAAFLWYLLAGASLAFAVLSLGAARLADAAALRLAAWTFAVFHGTAALVSAWAALTGLTPVVWANSVVHLVFAALFLAVALRRPRDAT